MTMHPITKPSTLSLILPVFLLLLPASTWASEVGAGFSLAVQYKQLEMEQRFTGLNLLSNSNANDGDLKATLPVATVQGILFYKQFYSVLKVENTLSESSVDSSIPFTTEGTSLSTDVLRNDISLVLGYNFNDTFSVFTGYMQGLTELTPDACRDVTCTNAASVMLQDDDQEYKQRYEEKGFFVGVGAGWRVGPGKVSASLAYAYMDGEYSDNYHDAFGSSEFDYEGKSKGTSTSLAWTAPLNEYLFYFVDGRAQFYSMDAKDTTGLPSFEGSEVATDETILGLSAGLQFIF
ncbi:hypothetical protein [Ketobacter sp.]|uniref:hypothetical protein n=1 Tax=Ketobacter sp. TaxID=2083498 RepID=UPI0025BB4BFD|nr:hypothetical protein [Ketobacter sp.]